MACRTARRIRTATFVNGVDPRPYVGNPGYLNPPDGANTQYYFTDRDAFHLEGQKRTDFAALYNYGLGFGGSRMLDFFIQAQVINLFNQFQLCGCGGNAAFALGGNVQNQTVDTAVRTNVTQSGVVPSIQPVHDHTGRGRALGEEPDVRSGAEPLRVHHAADVQDDVRLEVLVSRLRSLI